MKLERLASKLGTKIGLIVSVEIVLIAGSFAYLASYENDNSLVGNSINIAGKNRFLTAAVLLESDSYLADNSRKTNVEDSLKKLESNILLLRDGGKIADIEVGALPSDFINNWQKVYEDWITFKAKTERLISEDTPADEIPTRFELRTLGNNLISSSDILVTELGEYANQTSRDQVNLQIGLGILNIGVHFLMLYLIVRILKPIKLLTKAITAVREGNLNVSLTQHGTDEIQRLSESFNSMVESLRQSSHILAMERQKYHDLYDGAPDLYRMTDRKGIVRDCNDSYVKNLGYSDKSELIGKSIYETTADTSLDAMLEAFETWKRKGKIENKEIWLKRKDGTIFPTLISATAMTVYVDNKEIVASNTCIIDVTKMNKAKRDLEEANRRLAEVNKMKTDFIRIASHELRTPIQPILGYSELGRKGTVDPQKALEVINQQAQRLQHLANDILDITTIGAGSMGLQIEECPINEVIRKIVHENVRMVANDVKLELELGKENDEPMILADPSRIAQVITNVVSNAVKFTKQGSVKVSTKNVYDGRYIEICVSDTGSGIPQEILPSLFTIFAAKSVNEGAEHGTGFGLFISKAIVEAHGGSIIGYNNLTGGATFKMRLPTSNNERQLVSPT
jgi:PAS domain S-box-containing protein